MISNKINIDGLDIYYRTGGNKNSPVLLWLDGLSFGSTFNKRIYKTEKILNHFYKDYFVIALEYPAFMRSDIPNKIWSLIDYSILIDKFIDKLNLKSPLLLMGHSTGAKLCLDYAINYPKKVRQLIISAPPITYKFTNHYITVLNMLEKIILKLPMTKLLAKYILSMSPDNLSKHSNFQLKIALRSFSSLLREDFEIKINILETKTLVLAGKNDIFVPLINIQRTFKTMDNCRIILLNEGHFSLPKKLSLFYKS